MIKECFPPSLSICVCGCAAQGLASTMIMLCFYQSGFHQRSRTKTVGTHEHTIQCANMNRHPRQFLLPPTLMVRMSCRTQDLFLLLNPDPGTEGRRRIQKKAQRPPARKVSQQVSELLNGCCFTSAFSRKRS